MQERCHVKVRCIFPWRLSSLNPFTLRFVEWKCHTFGAWQWKQRFQLVTWTSCRIPIPSRWWSIKYLFLEFSPGYLRGEMIQVWRLHIFFRWVVSNTITRVLSCCFCDRVLLLMANISRKLMGFSHCFAVVYYCLYSPGGVSWMSSNYEAKLGVQITRHKPVSKAPVVLALYIVRRAYEGPTTRCSKKKC